MSNLYSANAHEILPGLWLGNKKAASDSDFLAKNNIRVVFNCTKDYPFLPEVLRKYRLPVDDNLAPAEISNMTRWSSEVVYKVIAERRSGENILIHCHAGMQRSAAVMAMVLIVLTGQSVEKVMEYIRSKRPVAFFPSANFDASIREFDRAFRAAA